MNVFIKFKILLPINSKEKKCVGTLLHCEEFVSIETDFKRDRLIVKTKKREDTYGGVILKSLEIINENGVKI